MKNLLLAMTLPISLFVSAQAMSAPMEPAHCPDVSSIQAAGLKGLMEEFEPGKWAVGTTNQKYDTVDSWLFAIILEANSADEAYAKAAKALPSLQFILGPIDLGDAVHWGCFYDTAAGYKAIAGTPANLSLQKALHR